MANKNPTNTDKTRQNPTRTRQNPTPLDVIARRRLDAATLLSKVDTWKAFTSGSGRIFWRIPGSRPGVTYTVNARSCTCPDDSVQRADRAPGPCKHRIALGLYLRVVRAHTDTTATIDGWEDQILGQERATRAG